ncbi:MAG: hypothetical protein HOP29_19655 [Phycisphaerales bacterium]|nr:hypothetical protein [Phycisphaerales bacterium]
MPRDADEPNKCWSVSDTQRWELAAEFKLEQSDVVKFYARNDRLDLVIPYEYHGIAHGYQPDFVVRLADDSTVLVEVKGFENDQDRAKHEAAKRWVAAVNNWAELGRWDFHVCHNPQLLGKELASLATSQVSSQRDG